MMRPIGQCIASLLMIESPKPIVLTLFELVKLMSHFVKSSSIVMRKNLVTAYFDVDITVKVCFLILFPFFVSDVSMLNILAYFYLSFSLYHFYIFILA